MQPDGIDTIYSPYVRNTAASSSTTMIVPNSTPPLDNNDVEEEMVEKKANNDDDVNHDHSLDIKKQKQPYYHYNSLEHPHTPLCQIHQDTPAPLNNTIPIPTHYVSSYFPNILSGTSISSVDAVPPSKTTTDLSPKKKVKRWIVAALMIVVGLLIALTFILIGLGKALSQPLHNTAMPSSSSLPLSSQPTYMNANATMTAAATNIMVSSAHHPTRT